MNPSFLSRGIFIAKKTQKYRKLMSERARQEAAAQGSSVNGFLLGPVVNIFPEVPRERVVTVEKLLLPDKAHILVQARQGRHENSFSNECFLHTDDWSQIQLSNDTTAEVEFRVLYFCPIEQYLRLILNKSVEAGLQAVIVINALGQPLRCSGNRWAFGARAVFVAGKLEVEFYDWAGLTSFVLTPPRSLQNFEENREVLETVLEETKSVLDGELGDPMEGTSTGTVNVYTESEPELCGTPVAVEKIAELSIEDKNQEY